MAHIQLERSNIGDFDATEEPKIVSNFTILQELLNGRLDGTNMANGSISADQLAQAVLAACGVNDATIVRRGKAIIPSAESTSSSTYTTLATPDRVTGITLPSDGLLFVYYKAYWGLTSGNISPAGFAAIFVDGRRVNLPIMGTNVEQFATVKAPNGHKQPLLSWTGGLAGAVGEQTSFPAFGDLPEAHAAIMSTEDGWGGGYGGNTPGGPAIIEADAGSHTVEIRFRASGGEGTPTVEVVRRRLRVVAIGF